MLKFAVVLLLSVALGLCDDHDFEYRPSEWLKEQFPDGRIVLGENANEGEFPYQVSLRIRGIFGTVKHYCGGSIIKENVVLTAAHCILNRLPPFATIEVAAGKHHTNWDERHVQVSKVLKTITHPKYNGGIAPYDIALIILATPYKYSEYVQPVALPKKGYNELGNATVTGWGSTSNTTYARSPDVLQKVTLQLVDPKVCRMIYGKRFDTELNICGGSLGSKKTACSGDSGGPLIQDINDIRTIVGIVSWGRVPCGGGFPSVYTRVSSLIDFIEKNSVTNSTT
ncbi:UNVERIFIED_CONTAM: hypothetical protein PYX00_002812 [Menopon gallinae]|uniref:Peptidase S1 domain-containing protein n=1 Tax=Menopon gallinae TaxID=328185 RepID=A0AAW2HY11_9NEOP